MANTTYEPILNNPLGGAIFYPLPSLASEKKCIRDTYRIRHPISRYVSYSSLGVFVPALLNATGVFHNAFM